jgi:hypothetical protein
MWKYIPIVLLSLVASGFGGKVVTPLPSNTPVIKDHIQSSNGERVLYYATIRCIIDGSTLYGYINDREQLFVKDGPIDLAPAAELTTILEAGKEKAQQDPECRYAGGFEAKRPSFAMRFF